jgi:serine protease SohB
MTEFIFNYGLFLAKAVTVVVAVGTILLLFVAAAARRGHMPDGLEVEKLNDRYRKLADTVRKVVMTKADWKRKSREDKKARKDEKKSARDSTAARKRIYVLNFKGDIRATGVSSLRNEVSAVAGVARPEDEVVVRLENMGGTVHEHGLAASQLLRLRSRGIPLTVIVDKVAASGGYLMASVADRVIAAPFAIIGSIGVLAQLPNFNRFLESRGIDFEQITAGKHKRTLSMFGKNTDENRAKMKEELEDVHRLFKQIVAEHRPELDVEKIATGEYWYGSRAKELGLIDELGSSDDYLMKAAENADVFSVTYKGRQTLLQKIQSSVSSIANSAHSWFTLGGSGPRDFFQG